MGINNESSLCLFNDFHSMLLQDLQVRGSNSIKWSTPGYGMSWREKYNCCVFISDAG